MILPATAKSPDAAPTLVAALRQTAVNATALFLAYVLPRVLTFGAAVVAARVLGADDFGAYGTAAALAVIMSVVTTLGMMPLLVRDIARQPEDAGMLLGAAHVAKTVANAGMLLALFILTRWVLGYPTPVGTAAVLLGVAYGIGSYGESLGAYFQGIERMHVWMQANAAFGVVSGVSGTVLVLATASVEWFCVAPILGHAAAVVWLFRRTPAAVRATIPSRADVMRLLRALAPFAAAFIVLSIYYKVDVLLLARWRPSGDVGIYAAAYKFVDVAQALTIVVVGAMYPRLARVHARADGDAVMTSRRLAELTLVCAVPAAGILWVARAPVIQLLFGPAYHESTAVLALLAPALPALAVNMFASFNLAAAERMRTVALVFGGGVAANVALNSWLIPAFGAPGAALAKMVVETGLALAFVAVLGRVGAIPRRRPVLVAGAAALSCAAVVPVARLMGDGAAVAGYVALLAMIYRLGNVLEPVERDAVRRLMRPPVRKASVSQAGG